MCCIERSVRLIGTPREQPADDEAVSERRCGSGLSDGTARSRMLWGWRYSRSRALQSTVWGDCCAEQGTMVDADPRKAKRDRKTWGTFTDTWV